MSEDIEEILDDIRKVRNDLVAQANPHFQSLTNIIYKWETKLVERTPEYKLKMFEEREQKEREVLEEISRKAREEENEKRRNN
jgi:4-diphosphocytidyl-2C-methyl-D-erythritol kinase